MVYRQRVQSCTGDALRAWLSQASIYATCKFPGSPLCVGPGNQVAADWGDVAVIFAENPHPKIEEEVETRDTVF